MVPADLWTLSQYRDPWKFFDLLILQGGLSDLHSWYSSSQSRALHFGGHHYGEWEPDLEFLEEPPELIEPNSGDWNGHVSKLLSAPVERVTTDIREEIRACATRDDADVQANRIQAQLNEYRDRLAEYEAVPYIDVIDSAILALSDYIRSRLQFFEVPDSKGTDHSEREPALSVGDSPLRGRPRDKFTSTEMLVPLLRQMLALPARYSHTAGKRKGKPNVSRISNDLMKDHPETCGKHSFEIMQSRVNEALNEMDDMS